MNELLNEKNEKNNFCQVMLTSRRELDDQLSMKSFSFSLISNKRLFFQTVGEHTQ